MEFFKFLIKIMEKWYEIWKKNWMGTKSSPDPQIWKPHCTV